jgi:O-acetyl-ADP-ribose deacetylase (regulator of RNase III)
VLTRLERMGTVIELVKGDIAAQEVDAIVNAANSNLMGGGGVDGAIHAAGGPAILEECTKIRETRGGCPPGRAVITTAGRLHAKRVIHTVGPVWRGGAAGEPQILARCYTSCLELAAENGLRTIAFPSIGTGAYRYPIEKAAPIAIVTVYRRLKGLDIAEVRFVLFTHKDLVVYSNVLYGVQQGIVVTESDEPGCGDG